jgi:peptide/nickel transport system ATP-binding protein
MPDDTPLLEVDDLHVAIESADSARTREAVRGVSFRLAAGEVLGIVGESGSGKTLTVSALAGLLPRGVRVGSGSVRFKGEDLRAASRHRLAQIRGRQIAMVFQDSLTSLNPVLRIGAQVQEPLLIHRLARGGAARAAAQEQLHSVGIPDPDRAMRRYPHEFSGGMRQRAMIATALIASPELIIADEPTTALDVTVQAQILEICKRLNRELNVALIVISHDLGVISELTTTLAVMYAGRIVEYGPTRQLLTAPQNPYTRGLLESMPRAALARTDALTSIPGEPPAPGALPAGCPFSPRCAFAEQRCREEEPSLLPVAAETQSACWVAQDHPLPPMQFADTPHGALEQPAAPRVDEGEPFLLVRDLVKHFRVPSGVPFRRGGEVHALDGVSLDVRQGETLGIVGESGCGKSTLARCILRLIDVDSGSITFRGRNVTTLRGEELRLLRRHMQPVFQDPYSSLNPSFRIGDTVAEPLLAHGVPSAEARLQVAHALDLVGLGAGYARRFPHQMSGGQRQRVGIARALVLQPELVVADEPISSLDVSVQAQVINLLKDIQRRLDLTLIFISHDVRLVRHLSTNIAVMFLGKVVEYGPSDEVYGRPRHPYTAALISAVLTVGADAHGGRIMLAGDPPSPLKPPSGCRFRTRCPRAQELCAQVEPASEPAGATHTWACHFPLEERSPIGAIPPDPTVAGPPDLMQLSR